MAGRRFWSRKEWVKTAEQIVRRAEERLCVPCRAAVFDLDGTLVDTLADLARSCNEALGELGFPAHPQECYRRFVGNGVQKLAERALPPERRTAADCEALRAAFDRRYAANYLSASRPYPGILELLKALSAAGVQLCVVSNKPHRFTVQLVEKLFPGRFRAVTGNRPGAAVKPDPAGVLEALEAVGVLPENAVYVGDSDVDVLTGHNAGMPVIGCLWGFRGEEELRTAGADRLVRTADEILQLLI